MTWWATLIMLVVRLHPNACAALRLEAERATPNHLGTQVTRRYMHALGTGCPRKSGEPLGFRPKRRSCASREGHPPGVRGTSNWRQSALPVLSGAALLGATSQVWWDVRRFRTSCAEPLPVRHRGDARKNHGAPLHDLVNRPTYLCLRAGALGSPFGLCKVQALLSPRSATRGGIRSVCTQTVPAAAGVRTSWVGLSCARGC